MDSDPVKKEKLKIGLKHWTGTLIVAVIAGFVIFGLVRGQEFLANFLINRELKKIEKEQKEIQLPYQENIQMPLVQGIIKITPKNTPLKSVFSPTPTPQITILPTPSPSPSPILTILLTSTPMPTPTPSPTTLQTYTSTPTPESGAVYQQIKCESWQVDINEASKEELDKIIHIGPSRADQIISLRQEERFKSVDDLTRVSGISSSRLNDIKKQGIACVQ